MALYGHVRFDSQAYQQYQCSPSDKFPGFTWCHKEKKERANGEEVLFSNSILHSQDGTAFYVNRYIEPAFFGPNEVQSEIDRLSAKFGNPARQIQMPERQGLPHAVIAIWGAIQLEQLNPSEISIVASGGSAAGLSVSFLGDLQRSAKAGVPVYRLAGAAGYLWVATFNDNGRGVLRYLAIDASQISPSNEIVTSSPPQSPASIPPVTPPPQPAEIETTRTAAEKGDADAQLRLASMFDEGRGVTKDLGQAVDWYRKAAEQGSAKAQFRLGLMFAEGRGITKDDTQAFDWYTKAAEQGYADAQFQLGSMMEEGRGVIKNEDQALDWYRKSAALGNYQAKASIDRIETQRKLLQEARDHGFSSVDDYNEFKDEQRKLHGAGIQMNH